MSAKAPWTKIKAEYIAGEDSIRELAEKYGVSENTLEKRATREKWSELRRETRGIVAEKLKQTVSDTKIKEIEGLVDRLIRESRTAAKQLKRVPVVIRERETDEEKKTEKVTIRTIYETGKTVDRQGLRLMAQTAKDLYAVVSALTADRENGAGTLVVRFEDDEGEDLSV